MRIALALFTVLAVLVSFAHVSASLDVQVTLSDGFAREAFVYSGEPGPLSFELPKEPVSVTADAAYELNGSTLTIEADETPIGFSVLFDDLIVSSGSQRVFRSSFSAEQVTLSVTLPEGASLDEAIPQGELSTDGSRIMIAWPPAAERSVAVFYTIEPETPWLLLVAFSLPILAGFGFLLYWNTQRRASTRVIDALLSENERAVFERVDGSRTQQNIADELGYSKSKMSKVVRKLEEKGLVGKEPHFKTNRLKRL